MQENTIFKKLYSKNQLPAVNEKEIWRYAGYFGSFDEITAELKNILSEVISDLYGAFDYKVCYRRMPIIWEGGMPKGAVYGNSKALSQTLCGCGETIIFAATIGLKIDRYISKNQNVSPLKALIAQAFGAERVESLCDKFCDDITDALSKEKLTVTKRFSPGYSDLPLETQTEFFKLLDCNRQIGISLGDSLLMIPSKSVTAIMGIKDYKDGVKEDCEKTKCENCNKTDCEYRKQESQ